MSTGDTAGVHSKASERQLVLDGDPIADAAPDDVHTVTCPLASTRASIGEGNSPTAVENGIASVCDPLGGAPHAPGNGGSPWLGQACKGASTTCCL